MFEPALTLLSEKIRCNSLRLTRQRRIIYEELAKVNTHPKAEEIFALVQNRIPQISFGTVYRNLKVLKELGLISEDKFGHNYSHFDANVMPHHHFTCVKCDQVFDVEDNRELNLERVQFPVSGFRVEYSRVEFYGRCPKCQEQLAGAQGG